MPLIRALRQTYPDASIDLIVKSQFAPIARRFSGLSSVIEFDPNTTTLKAMRDQLEAKHYTHVLDLHGNLRSFYLRRLGGAKVTTVKKRRIFRSLLVDLK